MFKINFNIVPDVSFIEYHINSIRNSTIRTILIDYRLIWRQHLFEFYCIRYGAGYLRPIYTVTHAMSSSRAWWWCSVHDPAGFLCVSSWIFPIRARIHSIGRNRYRNRTQSIFNKCKRRLKLVDVRNSASKLPDENNWTGPTLTQFLCEPIRRTVIDSCLWEFNRKL